MPLAEKLALMEAIWDELSDQQSQIEVPQWHKDLLDTRETLVREGKANFIDWSTAKEQIEKFIGK